MARHKIFLQQRSTTLLTWPFGLVLIGIFCISLLPAGCGGAGTPLDADTRRYMDSTSTAQIRIARAELDSLCDVYRLTVLPKMVDSIKQKRLQEIERQMQTVPK